MKCPHCRVEYHDDPSRHYLGKDINGDWVIEQRTCPSCKQFNFILSNGQVTTWFGSGKPMHMNVVKEFLTWPRGTARPPAPEEVPEEIAGDYAEACLVLSESPQASAALGRRCLQGILRAAAGVKPGDLSVEIQEVLDKRTLPFHIAETLDAVRIIGNFAAHPIKSQRTGEIVAVEAGEAEWNLEVLEILFDFYFVQPVRTRARKAALNQKLQEAGKQPLK